MTLCEGETRNLIFFSTGLVAGLLSAIAVNIAGDVYQALQFLVPGSIIDPEGIFYIAISVVGIALFIQTDYSARSRLTMIIMVVSGFLILFGLTMIGIATS